MERNVKWFTVRVFIADVDDTDMLEVMYTKVMAESAGEATELVVKHKFVLDVVSHLVEGRVVVSSVA